MNILSWYIARRFLAPFFFGLGIFSLLVFMGDLFDKMNHIVGTKASAWTVAQYLGLSVPYWTIRIVPMATLLATLFSVSGFIQTGEFIGVQASGFKPGEFFRPLLWTALALAAASFLFQETLLPVCYRRSQFLWRDKIHPEWEWDKYFDAVLTGKADQIVTASLFTVKDGTMDRPVMDYFGPAGPLRQVDARAARWAPEKGLWVFFDGVDRRMDERGRITAESSFSRLDSDLSVPPKDLAPRRMDPEEMSIRELLSQIPRAARMGESPHLLRTAMQSKLAYPFANLVLCALGIPIALKLRRHGRPVGFAAALAVCFLYLWLIEAGRALGSAGRLQAALAAWGPHLVFGAAALRMHRSLE